MRMPEEIVADAREAHRRVLALYEPFVRGDTSTAGRTFDADMIDVAKLNNLDGVLDALQYEIRGHEPWTPRHDEVDNLSLDAGAMVSQATWLFQRRWWYED